MRAIDVPFVPPLIKEGAEVRSSTICRAGKPEGDAPGAVSMSRRGDAEHACRPDKGFDRVRAGGASMKRSVLGIVMAAAFAVSLAASGVRAQSAAAGYDFKDMPDMSDFDPATWTSPTGDTIKVAIVASFSGPAALVGQVYWASAAWAAHDINKRGGIVVDGK